MYVSRYASVPVVTAQHLDVIFPTTHLPLAGPARWNWGYNTACAILRLATAAVAAAAAAAAAASVPDCPQDYLLASKLDHHILACPLWEKVSVLQSSLDGTGQNISSFDKDERANPGWQKHSGKICCEMNTDTNTGLIEAMLLDPGQ